MASSTPDINVALLRKVKGLTDELKNAFKTTFSKAPLVLKFMAFLEGNKQDKFKTSDAVAYLYNIKPDSKDYTLYGNRFFKLRKKVYDHLNSSPTDTHAVFTNHELQLHEIKNLVILGRYGEADPLLKNLHERLWADNIFELLPEVIDLCIQNNQMLKLAERNAPLYKKLDAAIKLFGGLAEAKKLARIIYEVNLTKGIKATAPLFNKLQRLSINNKQYPRFKLIYNYVSALCKMGGGGLDFKPDFKATTRFVSTVRKINEQYPDIPAQRFASGYRETQNYQFANLQVMVYFNALEFKESGKLLWELYQQVADDASPMKRMRSVTFYFTTCLVLNAGGYFRETLQVAKDYLSHLLEIKQHKNAIEAYFEICIAHIWLYPANTGYTEKFITDKLNEYIGHRKITDDGGYYYFQALWVKVQYLLVTGALKEAENLFHAKEVAQGFVDPRIAGKVINCIKLLGADSRVPSKHLQNQIDELKVLRLKSKVPPDYSNYLFLEKLLMHKLKKSHAKSVDAKQLAAPFYL